jgi:hypothetical protein
MNDAPTPSHLSRAAIGCALVPTPEDVMLVMLVGELPEAMRFTGDPLNADLVSDRFGGAWFGGCHDGAPAIAFGLVDLTSSDAPPATWYLGDAPDGLVARFVEVPHLVAVVPSDAPGVEAFGNDAEGTLGLLVHATIVEASCRLRSLERLALSRASGRAPATEDLVNVDDPDAMREALAPVHSRVARASGEMLTDNQVVPMAWTPWHYDLIAPEHRAAVHWRWPVVQVFFELQDPTSSDLEGIAAPEAAIQARLRSYLIVVQRLARSMALNSGGSVSQRWGRDEPDGTVDVDAPHDDALAALLPHLRQLFDPQEGSGLSFAEMLKALSAAAHAAGLAELVAELRRWKKAHAGLRRTHIGALQHQLAEEVAGESLGEPHRGFPGMPEMSPEQLIAIFMYGETLHRDAEKAAQVEAWDSDPLLGPLMRQEVRADAQAFVHFYGAFAGYVARWLEVADAQVAGEGEAADADG